MARHPTERKHSKAWTRRKSNQNIAELPVGDKFSSTWRKPYDDILLYILVAGTAASKPGEQPSRRSSPDEALGPGLVIAEIHYRLWQR